MARYYFHIINGRLLTDDVGMELADIETAKAEALKFAGAVLKDEKPSEIWNARGWQMQVSDSPALGSGRTLLTLRVSGMDSSDEP